MAERGGLSERHGLGHSDHRIYVRGVRLVSFDRDKEADRADDETDNADGFEVL